MPLIEVSREDWSALPPEGQIAPLQHPVHSVFMTNTDSEPCYNLEECIRTVQEIQRSHLEQGMQDVSYSFLVGGDGRVYEGRGWTCSTHPPLNMPECHCKSLIIATIGPASAGDPCKLIERATGSILDRGFKQKYIDDNTKYYYRSSKNC